MGNNCMIMTILINQDDHMLHYQSRESEIAAKKELF